MLFDWLTSGGIIDFNPAASVRGPKYSVKRGKTPVLTAEEARNLLDSIAVYEIDEETKLPDPARPILIGLRDRALIAVMVYSFARVSAALAMFARTAAPSRKPSTSPTTPAQRRRCSMTAVVIKSRWVRSSG